jgi:hypothetical protein
MFLVAGDSGAYCFRASIFSLPAMMVEDEARGGMKPFRTYEGMQYKGGYSDHLPILLEISLEGF